MISQSQIDYFKEVGIWYTGIPALDPSTHISSMRSFLSREFEYKKAFLQTKLDALFEGFSYMGQEDSANQYAADQLYTYVISDFFDPKLHANEFSPLMQAQKSLIPQISRIERQLLAALSPDLLAFYNQSIAHSLSANYYPEGGTSALRLTEHPDGSLLTVFPFGMDEQFQYEAPDGSWEMIEKTNEIVCFSGYLMELMTGIKALNHKVEKPGAQQERFSFAYFSIPKPNSTFSTKEGELTTEAYFKQYLSLFE